MVLFLRVVFAFSDTVQSQYFYGRSPLIWQTCSFQRFSGHVRSGNPERVEITEISGEAQFVRIELASGCVTYRSSFIKKELKQVYNFSPKRCSFSRHDAFLLFFSAGTICSRLFL